MEDDPFSSVLELLISPDSTPRRKKFSKRSRISIPQKTSHKIDNDSDEMFNFNNDYLNWKKSHVDHVNFNNTGGSDLKNSKKKRKRGLFGSIQQEQRLKKLRALRDVKNDVLEILESVEKLHCSSTSTPLFDSNKTKTPTTPIDFISPVSSCNTPISSGGNLSVADAFEYNANLKTLFLGITCYVDVRNEKENRSEPVKKELELMGAKIEKNLTKKVTHLIFREGLLSTYLKAEQMGIVITSILWIKACQDAKCLVDPTLYPPSRLEKYKDIFFFQTIKKRRVRLNKKCDTVGKGQSKPVINDERKALTDTKVLKESTSNDDIKKKCTKKLDFDRKKNLEIIDYITIDSTPCSSQENSTSGACINKTLVQRKLFDFNIGNKKSRSLFDPSEKLSNSLNDSERTKAQKIPKNIKESQNLSKSSLTLFDFGKKTPSKKRNPSIVLTRFSRSELKDIELVVQKLGMFDIEPVVTRRTTHVISKEPPTRTINIMKGMIRGCWIINLDWIKESEKIGKWVPEEDFELVSFSPRVTLCRIERQAFGKNYTMDIFNICGPIHISKNAKPSQAELKELVLLCRGEVVEENDGADVIVGRSPTNNQIPVVKEQWIFDSITQVKLLDVSNYIYNT